MTTINYNVPFYPNLSDNTHCLQAGLKMILKYFQPNKNFSWKELEQISQKQPAKWTWPLSSMVWMKNQSYDVVCIEVFDYKEFISKKEKYLYSFYGKEVAKAQIKNSNIDQEIDNAKKLIKANIVKVGIPNIKTIKSLLSKGYLVTCHINSQTLNDKDGYIGHFVVIKGFDKNILIINDPGLPPFSNRKVSFYKFNKSWAYPNKSSKNIMAFKLNK